MQQEKELALRAIRNLIAYYTSDFQVGNGYTSKQQLIYLTRPKMEIECPECLPPQKPVAPILGAYGNIFNLLCITNRALRQAGQLEQAEEMWRRVLDSGDNFKALAIMGEYVEFDEAYLPAAALCGNSSRGGGHG